jgi:Ca-activated chloride channel family protein
VKPGALVVAVLLTTGIVTSGQSPQFKSRVAAVRVDVLATDGRRPIPALTAADFELRDNGVVQTISDVHFETLPLNIICALDVSGSVEGTPLQNLKRAFRSVIDGLAAHDRAALVTFSHHIELHSALTDDRRRLGTLIDGVKAGGSTSLFDAVFSALALREADDGRSLLLVFSDGLDTSSWLTARKLLDLARRSDVVIYPITIRTTPATLTLRGPVIIGPSTSSSERLLEALTDVTGGRIVYASDDSALESTFLAVLQEFRQRYVLTFTPARVSEEGWHTLEVKLKRRSGEIRARRGYFAAPVP